MFQLHIIPALADNYIWLLENAHRQVIIVDPGDGKPIINYLNQHQLSPLAILLTHHHIDHLGGVKLLQDYYTDIAIYGPSEINLPLISLSNQHTITIADFKFDILKVPGHTLGHLAYYCAPYLFCGDTLFSAGCGRVFEQHYQQMLDSLNKLKKLPDNTLICAGHEYTLSNLKFATHMVPEDKNITQYLNYISNKTITLPSTLLNERQINLFLRCNEKNLQSKFNFNNELELFTFFRSQKDNF